MKLSTFIREKLAGILITAFILTSIWVMGYVFGVSFEYMTALSVLIIIKCLVSASVEYYRKNSFYREFKDTLDSLDQKYLISEMSFAPTFQEGSLMLEYIYDIDRSMKERLNDMEAVVSDFKEYIEMWIHEIKLPIAALSLMNYNENTDMNKQRIQINRMSYMVEQILFYTRADSPEKDYLMNACRLSAVVNKAVMGQKELLIGSKIGVIKEELDRTVITDSKWFEFILGQIINNSIKYVDRENKDRHYIKFASLKTDKDITLTVEDNGIGISDRDLPRVFDKTFTGENGRKGSASTGMGLYICKKLCEKLGHKIMVESVQGEYTRVILSFGRDSFYDLT